jgi:aryl-alcohol dehydrogenase-like predicted oxidoreductase
MSPVRLFIPKRPILVLSDANADLIWVIVPMEEIVRAFNYVIEQGWAFYWATSEWSAQQLEEAHRKSRFHLRFYSSGNPDNLGFSSLRCCDQVELDRTYR